MKKERILLIDTNSIIHRAFHALPPLKTKDGDPGGAVYGSLLAFFKILADFSPNYIVAVFDSPGKTFRHEYYKKYKAHRPKAPDELISQIKMVQKVFSEIGLEIVAREGYEADDIVGSIANNVPENIEVIIATGDLDILQLATEKVKVYTLKRGVKDSVLYDKEKVAEKYEGLSPERIPDIKALKGDASDNIPGVEGVGEKTAVKLIKKFSNIETIYSLLDKEEKLEGFGENIIKKLKKDKEKAFLSKKLATIDKDSFSSFQLSDFSFKKNSEKIRDVLQELGFNTLAKRFSGDNFIKKEDIASNNLKFNF